MFVLLSRVILWLLLLAVLVSLFQRFYPKGTFIGRLFLVIAAIIVFLAFINPAEPAIASLWRVVSFPLKPLGAAILLLMFSAQGLKDGAIAKPGGAYVASALIILLLASTPAVAYFLVQSPLAKVTNPDLALDRATLGTLVAMRQDSTFASVSDVLGNQIIPQVELNSYLLQTPSDIPRRGLRLEDFVPNAETLSLTTRVWENYLNQIFSFLRG